MESTWTILSTVNVWSWWERLSHRWSTLLVISIVCIWLTCMIWVARDISARTENTTTQIISILLVTILTPIIWIPLYLLIRPTGWSYDMNGWRESLLIKSVDCLHCGCKNLISHSFCVFCGEWLKTKCKECTKEYPFYYEYCPSCWAPHIKDVIKKRRK